MKSTISSQGEKPLLATPWLLHADVELATPKGEIDVRISPGTIGLDPFAQPVHLQYTIIGGTGAYENAAGKGLVDLRLYQGIPKTPAEFKQAGDELKSTGIHFSLDGGGSWTRTWRWRWRCSTSARTRRGRCC